MFIPCLYLVYQNILENLKIQFTTDINVSEEINSVKNLFKIAMWQKLKIAYKKNLTHNMRGSNIVLHMIIVYEADKSYKTGDSNKQ